MSSEAVQRRRFGRVFPRSWPSGRTTWSAQWSDPVARRRLTRHFDSERDAEEFLVELRARMMRDDYAPPMTHAGALGGSLGRSAVSAPMEPRTETPLRTPPSPTPRALTKPDRAADSVQRAVPSFVDYARELIDRRLSRSLAKGTLGLYEANLKALRGFYGAKEDRPALRLDEISASSFLDYRAWRRGVRQMANARADRTVTTVSPATINRDQQFVSRVLAEAILDGHLATNPIAGLRKLKEARHARGVFTKEEIRRMMRKAPWRFRALVIAAVHTGARKSELVRLRWQDIDFERGKIVIFRQKTGTGDALDIHARLATALEKLRELQRRAGNTAGPGDHVFLSRRGRPYQSVKASMRITLRRAGLGDRHDLTFHSFRHSFATYFLERAGAVTDLQQQLGHADLSTTQVYAKGLSERRRAAVMALDFGGQATQIAAVSPDAVRS